MVLNSVKTVYMFCFFKIFAVLSVAKMLFIDRSFVVWTVLQTFSDAVVGITISFLCCTRRADSLVIFLSSAKCCGLFTRALMTTLSCAGSYCNWVFKCLLYVGFFYILCESNIYFDVYNLNMVKLAC